jgi:hypothetical protein
LAGSNHFAPHLCPDGKTLVFGKGGPIIAKCNLETGVESEIVKIAPTLMGYDLSPDGKEVVYQVNHTVKIMSINGGEPRELFIIRADGGIQPEVVEGRSFIIAGLVFSGRSWQIFSKALGYGGSSQGGAPINGLAVPMTSFALHLITAMRSVSMRIKERVVVVENFLP